MKCTIMLLEVFWKITYLPINSQLSLIARTVVFTESTDI